jgi:hypothetical protein
MYCSSIREAIAVLLLFGMTVLMQVNAIGMGKGLGIYAVDLIYRNHYIVATFFNRSRDEDSRQNEKLTIDSQGFIIATSSNSSKPITWYQYTDNGRSIDVIDRIFIK